VHVSYTVIHGVIMPYSKKQMKIARMAPPRNKITGADFAMLKQKKKNGKKK
jgi:hypothetical protein